MENQTIAFIQELTKQVEIGNKTMTRRLTGLEKVNISPDDFRFDGLDEKDPNIYYFEELKFGEPTENYIIARSKYTVDEIVSIESSEKKIQIISVRAERLQDISEEDAIKEGIEIKLLNSTFGGKNLYKNYLDNPSDKYLSAISSFSTLSKKIYGEDCWYYNPFVWVYEFKLV